jgi:hypothetical protein
MAASGLRLGGEQWRKRTGPHQTWSGHVSSPDPRLGPAQGPVHVLSWDLAVHGPNPAQGVRGPSKGPGTPVEVLDLARRSGLYV